MPSAVYYLAIPSLVVFVLLIVHNTQNRGRNRAMAYFGAVAFYGWIRAVWLDYITKEELGSAFPYLINLPVLKFGGVSLQEIIGWGVAATLAWLLADRMLRSLKITPGPHRTAALGALVMCAVCLAVETAAIEAGWWQWTIILRDRTIFGRVPLVGLLDWGFVAFDFLLPFLLLASHAPWRQRLPALSLFFLHFGMHPKTKPFAEPLMLSPNDLTHAAIFAYVLIVALDERTPPLLDSPGTEKMRWIPPVCAAVVAAATACSNVFEAHAPFAAAYSLPLLILGIGAYLFPRAEEPPQPERKATGKKESRKKRPDAARAQAELSWGLFAARIAVVVLVFALVYALRAPFYRRTNEFLAHLNKGIEFMNARQLAQAESEFRKGSGIRPEHPGGHVMLGQVLFLQQRMEEARAELEKALSFNATDTSALALLSAIEIRTGRWEEAKSLAATGMRAHPERFEFRYLAAVANQGKLTPEPQGSVLEEIRAAQAAGSGAVNALGLAARNAGDSGTLRLLMAQSAPSR